jgi:hypothetical protein
MLETKKLATFGKKKELSWAWNKYRSRDEAQLTW